MSELKELLAKQSDEKQKSLSKVTFSKPVICKVRESVLKELTSMAVFEYGLMLKQSQMDLKGIGRGTIVIDGIKRDADPGSKKSEMTEEQLRVYEIMERNYLISRDTLIVMLERQNDKHKWFDTTTKEGKEQLEACFLRLEAESKGAGAIMRESKYNIKPNFEPAYPLDSSLLIGLMQERITKAMAEQKKEAEQKKDKVPLPVIPGVNDKLPITPEPKGRVPLPVIPGVNDKLPITPEPKDKPPVTPAPKGKVPLPVIPGVNDKLPLPPVAPPPKPMIPKPSSHKLSDDFPSEAPATPKATPMTGDMKQAGMRK